jgi:hypoxanthine phosphoribosyltransferase
MLSHKLNIPLIVEENQITQNTLIVDDICDSGETFLSMLDEHQKGYEPEDAPKFACLHYKYDTSDFSPDFFGVEIRDFEGWIVYPWEREDADTIQDYLK